MTAIFLDLNVLTTVEYFESDLLQSKIDEHPVMRHSASMS